jgi:alpha-amylase/alpha-mannosidase (GH57 family)
MQVWHGAEDTVRSPLRVRAGERVHLRLGTWPIQPDQSVWVEVEARSRGADSSARSEAIWSSNAGSNSYWHAELGPYSDGDRIEYRIEASGPDGVARTGPFTFTVGARMHLAILWHQHQPLYKVRGARGGRGSYRFPWVRLHALRDYFGMASILESHPDVHLTINYTPVLLQQIEDYARFGATDRALELTRRAPSRLSAAQRNELLGSFFEASWHTQIYVWPRYRELFDKRTRGERFKAEDLRDLQMWFNLAWFAPELQHGAIRLPDGDTASVARFVTKGSGFSSEDIDAMLEEQQKILRNVIALHRALQDRGQLEISTTPFYHPILPLLIDTDAATIDRSGATHPERFTRPQDAQAQVQHAVELYTRCFGRPPRGMWPAEAAISPSCVAFFASAGIEWLASDRGVLARSGRYGYDVSDPEVLSQPYRAEDEAGARIALFFRDTELSDRIGFRYASQAPADAARDFVDEVKRRFAERVHDPENRVLCIALDGENAWGSYPEQGRTFLHALYAELAKAPEIRTVTLSEYLGGSAERAVPSHPPEQLTRIHDLHTGSWIDEQGSDPGSDLGTWIGEPEENLAWNLLRRTAATLDAAGATPATHPDAFESLLAAEGSDWFWWFGDDQSSDSDAEFDDLFRAHLKAVYRASGRRPPLELDAHIVPHAPVFTFARPVRVLQKRDRLVVRTNCPGRVEWRASGQDPWSSQDMIHAGGAIAGLQRYGVLLGPFLDTADSIELRFICTHPSCDGCGPCCNARSFTIRVEPSRADAPRRRVRSRRRASHPATEAPKP